MATKTWDVETDGGTHAVALEWGYWGGRRKVTVDGEVVDESTIPLRAKSTQRFELDGRPCVVRTKPSSAVSPFFVIALEVDGQAVPSTDKRDTWESKHSS